MTKTIHANIVSDKKVYEGEITFSQKIIKLKKISDTINPQLDYILPGFVDLHIHGGGGSDIMDQTDPSIILKTHAKNGTTSLLLTTVTATKEELLHTFSKIQNKKQNMGKGESNILGIHLEGPFISKDKLGAQPEFTRVFDASEIENLNNISPIKIITLAPELMEQSEIKKLIDLQIIVQIGHSNGCYEDTCKAIEAGAKSFTHLFNAMSGFHHRNPGVAGAALAHAEFSELIPDLLHVHPGAIKVALRAIPKLYFVTDATSATGMPDGEFKLGTHHVTKCQNGVRLKDGTLAGSALTMLQAFKNLIKPEINLSIAEASYRLSTIPCELLGISHERGKIDLNQFSDLLVLDSGFNIKKVFIEGVEA